MTPEEKAEELGKKYSKPCHGIGDCEFEATQAALEMAQWKEQQMIEKVVKWLENNYSYYEQTYADVGGYIFSDFDIDKMLIDFKQAMKEE